MSDTHEEIDMAKARLDPGGVFASPEALVDHPALGRDQKIELLRRWAYDASEVAVAEEEGMLGETPLMLGRILRALDQLTGGYDVEHGPPTKQAGIPKGGERRIDHHILERIEGAIAVLEHVNEILELRRREAVAVDARETLNNVLGYIQSLLREYQRRRDICIQEEHVSAK